MSNSKSWKSRKEELDQKEQLLLEQLTFKSSKTKKIVLWSLGSGIVTLAGYIAYRAFTIESSPQRKAKTKSVPEDLPLVNSAIKNLGPSLGKWLLKQLRD